MKLYEITDLTPYRSSFWFHLHWWYCFDFHESKLQTRQTEQFPNVLKRKICQSAPIKQSRIQIFAAGNCMEQCFGLVDKNLLHIWSLQLISQDYNIALHTTYIRCANFIHVQRYLQFKVDSKLHILWETLFVAILVTHRVFARTLLIFSLIPFCWSCVPWYLSCGLTTNMPTHHLLDYEDF